MLDISIFNETSPETNWNRQADRQVDRQADRQVDRQTDGHDHVLSQADTLTKNFT